MRRVRNIITSLLAALLIVGSVTPLAVAQDSSTGGTPTPEVQTGPRFILRPIDGVDGAFFTVNAKAGETVELTAVLGNVGNAPIDLHTFTSDAVVLVNGGFGVKEEDAQQTAPTTWIDWPSETFTFEPGEGIEREFTVSIPEDAEPGQYIAGLSLETAEPIEIQGSTMFDQIIRKAVAVFITVEGETTTSFELGEPEIVTTRNGGRLQVPVINTGDVLVRPAGTVALTTADGKVVFSADVSMGSVYARMETFLAIPLDAALVGQEYDLTLELTDEASGITANVNAETLFFSGEIPEEAPVQLAQVSIAPSPGATAPVFAAIDLTIANTGEHLTNANVILHVYHDGELVEDFTLGSNMIIAVGQTTVSQRYIPADGFASGEWSFTLTIETVTPQTNATTVVFDQELPVTIEVP